MISTDNRIYCIDTSSLIEMKFRYPPHVFPTLWTKLQDLANKKRLIAPSQVFKELQQVSDEVSDWAKRNKSIFKRVNNYPLVKEIIAKFPNLIDPRKESSTQADPYVIALAVTESNKQKGKISGYTDPQEYVIVAEDGNIRTAGKGYNISSIKIVDVFSLEGWQF